MGQTSYDTDSATSRNFFHGRQFPRGLNDWKPHARRTVSAALCELLSLLHLLLVVICARRVVRRAVAVCASCAFNAIHGTLGQLCLMLPWCTSDCNLELGAKNARTTVIRCVVAWRHRHRANQHETVRLRSGAMAAAASAVSRRGPMGGRLDAALQGAMGTTGERGRQVALSPVDAWDLTPLPWLAPACSRCGQG